jgi:hypothetical protein
MVRCRARQSAARHAGTSPRWLTLDRSVSCAVVSRPTMRTTGTSSNRPANHHNCPEFAMESDAREKKNPHTGHRHTTRHIAFSFYPTQPTRDADHGEVSAPHVQQRTSYRLGARPVGRADAAACVNLDSSCGVTHRHRPPPSGVHRETAKERDWRNCVIQISRRGMCTVHARGGTGPRPRALKLVTLRTACQRPR